MQALLNAFVAAMVKALGLGGFQGWVASILLKYGGKFTIVEFNRLVTSIKQYFIDKKNVKKYEQVKEGKLSDEEDTKDTEDLLNGRTN